MKPLSAGLAATWVTQFVGTASIFGVPVLAAMVAPDMGVDPTLVGAFVSVTYLTAQVVGLLSGGLIARFGAIRVSQTTSLCAALGLIALFPASPWLAILAAVLLGCGYGPLNPASAQVLMGLSSPRRQPLVFSIKQTAVPAAGILAGALLPVIAVSFGWRWAFATVALVAVVVMLTIQPLRGTFDAGRERGGGRPRFDIIGPLRLVLRHRALRGTSFSAFALAGAQISVASFFVLYLTQAQGWSLVNAGGMYAVVQVGGVCGRVFWGTIAKQLLSPLLVLTGLSLLIGGLFLAVALMTPDWPLAVVAVVSFLLGLCSFGWNGVLLSEVADLAPERRVGDATGGSQFIMFGGVTVLPPLFGAMVNVTGSYLAPFVGAGAFVVLLGGYLVATRRV